IRSFPPPAESDGEGGSSSEDEGDIQFEILEIQRDEANQRLSELEDASAQLLKEINVLEMQFQIERSCRESAEAFAVKVTKENKVLKRTSQMMMMPLIPELPENSAAATFDPQTDPAGNRDEVDDVGGEMLLLDNQAQIAELQASVDALLAEKMLLEQQVEDLTKEQVQLREQLALEVEEKDALLRKISKQNKTMNKIKRVSQLVTEEFSEMSQKLELEQDLRQHVEVFAHQVQSQRLCVLFSVSDLAEETPLLDMKAKAVDEMMERIKRGIVLRPTKITQVAISWKDKRNENRKSAILELKGVLDTVKRQQVHRVPSRRALDRNVREAELLQVLQRRRRAMGEVQDQNLGTSPGAAPWAGESGTAPVLRRLKQNREKRDSRIRMSALIDSQEN
uniref:Shootin 2 n=1 Tax=Gasterosteus aculeatus aculeatus TaxID=481459 RepID=A0AAQ4RUS7_GASAC